MKKIKGFLLLITILLLCGCSGSYNLTINNDLSVTEELDLKLDNELNTYERTLDIFDKNDISNKKYKVVASDKDVKINYKETYESIEDYVVNSKLYRNMFSNLNYNNDGKNISFNTNSTFNLKNSNSEFVLNEYDISSLKINVKVPYKITYNNADEVNKDKLTWSLDRNTTSKKIAFTFNKYNNRSTIYQLVIIILISVISLFSIIYLASIFIRRQKVQ